MKIYERVYFLLAAIKDFTRWLFGRSSNSAMLILIDIAEDFDEKDIGNAIDYLISLQQFRDTKEQKNG